MKEQKEIRNFFNPKKIAVIGASDNPEKIGNILMKKLKNFKGEIIPINPNKKIIENLNVYSNVLKYPKEIDLAIIATPAKTVNKILKQCGKKKIKNIVIISAGFSETNNENLTKKMLKLKEKYKLNILGPNCFGFFNPNLNLDLTFAKSTPSKGHTAFISQSGALWSYISDLNIEYSGFVSLGNMVDIEFSDFLEYFEKDRNTKKIICYVEKLKEGRRFIEIAKKLKKEVRIIKAGKTERGKKVTLSHTGSLATDFEVYKGAFEQGGINLEKSLSSALKIKKENLISRLIFKKVIIITNAGGAAGLITDELTSKEFEIDKVIDILGTAKSSDYERTLKNFENYEGNILVILTPQTMSEPEQTARIICQQPNIKKIIPIFLGENSIKEALKIFKQNNVKVLTKCV